MLSCSAWVWPERCDDRGRAPVSGYTLVLPPPWKRINLGPDRRDDVRRVMDQAMAQAPKEIPPDQLAPTRRRLEADLNEQLDRAVEGGGVDFYFPVTAVHGVHLNASFVVSSVVPDAVADTDMVPGTLAELVRGGAEAVTVQDTVWARTESVAETDGSAAPAGVRARQVDYFTAVPGDGRRWVLVSCSVIGDGDPDSTPTGLVVELFDAMMSTWRWQA